MPYKDKETEREAARLRQQRHRSMSRPEDCHALDVTPDTEGVDGWHIDGRRYVFQDTGMGGLVRNYRGGPALFLYSRSWR